MLYKQETLVPGQVDPRSLARYIDHTVLYADTTRATVERFCREAVEHKFASVCFNPTHVAHAAELLRGTGVKVCTVIGFPLGANTSRVKAFETEDAARNGADEFDMVINVGALKDGRHDDVRGDIRAVVTAADGKCVKVIIETFLLTDAEKITAVELSCQAGACFVKTCTGFSGGAASVDDIRLMKAHVSDGVQIKASGGIRDAEMALALVEAGADRLGTSAGVAILGKR